MRPHIEEPDDHTRRSNQSAEASVNEVDPLIPPFSGDPVCLFNRHQFCVHTQAYVFHYVL